VNMFDVGNTGMIGLPYRGKTMTTCSAVLIQYQRVTDRRTDRRTDRIVISISRVSVLTRDKNTKKVVQYVPLYTFTNALYSYTSY